MTLDPLAGHVVVLAGVDASTGVALLSRGVLLAVVSSERSVIDTVEQAATQHPTSMLLSYRADPCDPQVWDRVAAHIEQRVGPVDAVLCTKEAYTAVEATFAADLGRRGHGVILPVSPGEDPIAELPRLLRRTP
ncbi:MAG TPA: hypothetical protein VFH66_04065 [Mycobacteriales bacterium]|nr:hypothetical protein [Mycobacteriales bacterium]